MSLSSSAEVAQMATTTIATPRNGRGSADPIARTSAVAWIDGWRAFVARVDGDEEVSTRAINRGATLEPTYLAEVVDAIGDRERVMIFGPGSERLALERAYVAIHRRPERLVDVEPGGPVGEDELVELARNLAG
jgi:hypothetical protein